MGDEKREKRERGSLPKAYLRIDPNIDHIHERPGEMLVLLCAAARQPRRGRFKSRPVLVATLGRTLAKRVLERKDVVDHLTRRDCAKAPEGERLCGETPHLYVAGWDEWQEGDLEVAARMRRLRDRHRGVTEPSPERNGVTEEPPIPDEDTGVTGASPERNAVTSGVRRQASGVFSFRKDAGLREPGGALSAVVANARERVE